MKSNKKRSPKTGGKRGKKRIYRFKNRHNRGTVLINPVMLLVAITFAFNEQTTPEKWLARIRMHILKLTGNPHFPTTTPDIPSLVLKADELEGLIASAASGDRDLILQRDQVIAEVRELITQLGYDIQKQSGGDVVKIESAGFKTRKPRGAAQPCTKVIITKIEALTTGEIMLEWSKVIPALVYWIEVKTAPDGPWMVVDLTANLNFKLNGYLNNDEFHLFVAGQRYYFRVRAWNRLGFGAYSEVVDAICTD